MSLTKAEVQEKLKELYVFNASLKEEEVKKKRKKLYKDISAHYRNWDRALQSCGITKRKLREREKFTLYFLLKGRYEKFGPEAIRHINVKPLEVKERIVHSFKTIKALKDIVLEWDEDKIMYELHAAFLSGATIEELAKVHPVLHREMLKQFSDIEQVLAQYDRRFGLPHIGFERITEAKEVARQETVESKEATPIEVELASNGDVLENDDLIDMMIKLNYIESEADAQAIVEANKLRKEDVAIYLFDALAHAQKSGVKITERAIRENNPVIYFAMKAYYANLENALSEMMASLIDIK